MIRTLIIEDEEPAALRLEKLLAELDPAIQILDKLESVESSVSWLKNNPPPDLVMLDIQLADGLSFEIFKKVNITSFVIFTTAYDEYAIKAFELNSIDYLLKPIDKAKLEVSIVKYKSLSAGRPQIDMEELIRLIENKKTNLKKRFAVSIGTKIKSIETSDISFFFSMEKSTFLCTFDGHEYPVDFSLDRIESLLEPELFFRISRSHLINFKAIQKIHLLSKSRLEVEVSGSNQKVMVSTQKTHGFRSWIDK
jgi:DNA-binding LytR/AlgR family response regulator